eukprot:6920177-Pyramimonas_sp.AAC.1
MRHRAKKGPECCQTQAEPRIKVPRRNPAQDRRLNHRSRMSLGPTWLSSPGGVPRTPPPGKDRDQRVRADPEGL